MQNKEGCLQTPGGHQIMIIKYLSVGQWSWFLYQQVTLNVLFQMRYDSMPYSKKQPSDRQRAERPPVFTSLWDCFAYCFAHWHSPGVVQTPSTFWSVIIQPLGAYQATIQKMKEDILSFHMRVNSWFYTKRLQRYKDIQDLSESPLVKSATLSEYGGLSSNWPTIFTEYILSIPRGAWWQFNDLIKHHLTT